MLISRGLAALLLGPSVGALGRHSPSESQLDLRTQPAGPSPRRPIETTSQERRGDSFARLGQIARGLSNSEPSGPVRPRSGRRLEWPAAKRWQEKRQGSRNENSTASETVDCQDGGDTSCPGDLRCCLSSSGEASCCGENDASCDGGDCTPRSSQSAPAATSRGPAAFVTETVTSTLTVFSGPPETVVVISTTTELITLLNPVLRTQTSTITVTSFFRRAKRTIGVTPGASLTLAPVSSPATSTPKATGTQDPPGSSVLAHQRNTRSGYGLGKRQEIIIASVVTFTTVFVRNVVTSTLFNTVFSTTVVAPNAVTTVFVTATVFRPSVSSIISASSGSNATPTASGDVSDSPSSTPSPSSDSSFSSVSASASTTSAATSSSISTASSSVDTTTSLAESSAMSESMTMDMMTTTSASGTPAGPLPTLAAPAPTGALTAGQIAGITFGTIFGLLLLFFAAFLLRRFVQKRRREHARMRQQIKLPEEQPPCAALAVGGLGTDGSNGTETSHGGHSGLTGEGEVRIVIRPAPKRRTQSSQVWPMPPGQRGQSYSLFVEETTTGESSPQDPANWSIASDQGSIGDAAALAASSSGGRPSMATVGGHTSILSMGWDTSLGGRSEVGSYPGIGTLLTPPPAGHRAIRMWGDYTTDASNNNNTNTSATNNNPTGGSGGVTNASERSTSSSGGNAADSNREDGAGNGSGSGSGSGYPMGSFGIGRAW